MSIWFGMIQRILKASGVVVVVLLCAAGCGGDDNLRRYGFTNFRVVIEQDGLVKQAENSEVELERKPFRIRLYFIDNDSVFVNASYSPAAFDAAMAGRPIEDVPGFGDPAITEEPFNRESVLNISDRVPNFWYYAGDGEHRFSTVSRVNDLLLCDREIARVSNADVPGDEKDIAATRQDAIYLVFAQLRWSDDYTRKIEYKRECLKITFFPVK
ncbi:MAG: hypothetical protein JXA20_14915 [Spirochaetes bacterium]|nr:hypothetical protein [Spirochaetota bacterium]